MVEAATDLVGELGSFLSDHNFVIGGGFTRDIRNHKPIKDIDIIMNMKMFSFGEGRAFDAWLKSRQMLLLSGDKAYNSQSKGNNFKVYGPSPEQKVSSKDVEVQIIACQVPPLLFIEQTFDYGLCQVATLPSGDVYASDQYMMDEENKTLTLMVRESITPYQLGYALKDHLPRLQKKFPTHKLVVSTDIAPTDVEMARRF